MGTTIHPISSKMLAKFLIISLLCGIVTAFDSEKFLKTYCHDFDRLYCTGFQLTDAENNEFQNSDFTISNSRRIEFSNCTAGNVNENFFSKFPAAENIVFVNCSMNLMSSVKAVGPTTHPLKLLTIETSLVYRGRLSNAFKSLVELTSFVMKSSPFFDQIIDEHLFASNSKLQHFNFTTSWIYKIEKDAFKNLVNLETINLSGNQFNYPFDPEIFANQQKLGSLDLSDSNLKWIPSNLVFPKTLMELWLGKNKIVEMKVRCHYIPS